MFGKKEKQKSKAEIDALLEAALPKGREKSKKLEREARNERLKAFKKLMKVLEGKIPPIFGDDAKE